MPYPKSSDASVYEFALYAGQVTTLQLSPTTLKAVVSMLVDLLIEQKVPAIVWAKLPKGELWQADLDRYHQFQGTTKTIYCFKAQRDDANYANGFSNPSINTQPTSQLTLDGLSSLWTIPLNSDALRRQYFLLVWSPSVQVAILAQRSRSTSKISSIKAIAPDTGGLEMEQDENSDRKQLLPTLCSFDEAVIQRALRGIEATIAVAPPAIVEANISTEGLIRQWQQQMRDISTTLNPLLLGQFFTKLIQKQEDTWQRSMVYRKQAEITEMLKLQNDELTTTVRLKDDFLNNVGQELRTPLTTIKTALTLLNSPNLKLVQRQRYLDLITKECDRQSSLITSLLDLVQLDQTAEQTVIQCLHLGDIVPGVVSTYQPLAEEKGVMLAFNAAENLPPIACATSWLKQIVINLLHNSIKFTPTGGQVWVRARSDADYVQLEFRDTGVGIAPSEIPKIFDRFYRTRQSVESASGAGLGLTIVQQLLIHCGGSISVQSKLGEGSTFIVLLPIYKAS
jgi:signal transduction histidine kinase